MNSTELLKLKLHDVDKLDTEHYFHDLLTNASCDEEAQTLCKIWIETRRDIEDDYLPFILGDFVTKCWFSTIEEYLKILNGSYPILFNSKNFDHNLRNKYIKLGKIHLFDMFVDK